jgi:hypothetical protein
MVINIVICTCYDTFDLNLIRFDTFISISYNLKPNIHFYHFQTLLKLLWDRSINGMSKERVK